MTRETERSERKILDAIIGGVGDCQAEEDLLKAGARGEKRGIAPRALAYLLESGWLEQLRQGKKLIPYYTLSPLGAERLDVQLICPEKDSRPEPFWGSAGINPRKIKGRGGRPIFGESLYDRTGRYAAEPEHFIADLVLRDSEGNRMGRSIALLEDVARVRVSDQKTPVEILIDREADAPWTVMGQAIAKTKSWGKAEKAAPRPSNKIPARPSRKERRKALMKNWPQRR